MKNINTELIIGLFMIAGFLAFGYLSLQMGEFSVFDLEKNYSFYICIFPDKKYNKNHTFSRWVYYMIWLDMYRTGVCPVNAYHNNHCKHLQDLDNGF